MGAQPEIHGGFILGPNGTPHNVVVAFNGNDTYIADNVGQQAGEFWNNHNHYRQGGYDGGGGNRPHYTGPGH